MFYIFTPFRFLFIFFYLGLVSLILRSSSFLNLWCLIEFMMLVFMGLSFSIVVIGLSHLIGYFLIQAVSSTGLFIFFLSGSSTIFSLFMLLKLSIFPFIFWFINLIPTMSSFMVFIVGSFQKLPPFFMLYRFSLSYSITIIIVSSLLNLLFCVFLISTSLSLRIFLVVSSVANNSWIFLSQLISWKVFIIFFVFYSFYIIVIFILFGPSLAIPSGFLRNRRSLLCVLTLVLLSLAAFPPFPLFFVKVLVIYSIVHYRSILTFYAILMLVLNSFLIYSYLKFIFVYRTSAFFYRLF